MRSRRGETRQSGLAQESESESRRRTAAGYVRAACVTQQAPRSALDAQIAKIREAAIAEGLELAQIFEDPGESAHDLKRPGLTRLFLALDVSPIGVVIVADLSRLVRSASDLLSLLDRLHRCGAALIAVEGSLDTRTAEGRRTLTELAKCGDF